MNSDKVPTMYFTYVEDDLEARKKTHLTLWAQSDRKMYESMKKAFDILSPALKESSVPTNLAALDGCIVAVLIKDAWFRCRLRKNSPGPCGLVDVFCIDLGRVVSVRSSAIRTLPSSSEPEAKLVKESQPLAKQYYLYDVRKSENLWPDESIRFAKALIEDQQCRVSLPNCAGSDMPGIPVGVYNGNDKIGEIMFKNGLGKLQGWARSCTR